jgi:uncharacterized protein (DUF58 family)
MLTPELVKKIHRIEIRTRRLVNESFAGAYQATFKGLGMEFAEVRPYVPGDEVRTIDWNVTARMGQPYIKRFVEERELTVMLLFDASASGDFGSVGRIKRELGAELAAVLAFCATGNNDRVGLLVFSDRIELFIPPRKGRRHVLRLIRDLLAFQPRGRGTDLNLALNTISNVLKRRSIVFLVSDFLAAPQSYRKALFIASRKHDLVAVDLHDPLEGNIPPAGLLALEDAESGKLTWVDSASRAWQLSMQQRTRQHEAEKKALFTQSAVDRIAIRSGEEYISALAGFFQQRIRRLWREAR